MTAQMHKLAEQQEFERAQEIKKRIQSLDLLQQEQSFHSSLISVDFFACVSKLDRTGICILSVRDGKIRGTKTHYLKGNQLIGGHALSRIRPYSAVVTVLVASRTHAVL